MEGPDLGRNRRYGWRGDPGRPFFWRVDRAEVPLRRRPGETYRAGVFLVATPYWGAEDWEVDEYALREDFASKLPEGLPMFFYHGRDDEVVPFEHLALYAERLPRATFRGFDGRGHQFGDDLSEVARDIEGPSRMPPRNHETGEQG